MPKWRAPRRQASAAMLSLTLILSGCGTMMDFVGIKRPAPIDVNAVYCRTYEPIRWSTADTDGTIRQVRRENAKWTALCALATTD